MLAMSDPKENKLPEVRELFNWSGFVSLRTLNRQTSNQ